MEKEYVKIITFAPENVANKIREAMGKAGAGVIGTYTHCSFSTKGTGRFIPGEKANPSIGNIGKEENVSEEKIEMLCKKRLVESVAKAIRLVHPYEEVPIEVYPVETI